MALRIPRKPRGSLAVMVAAALSWAAFSCAAALGLPAPALNTPVFRCADLWQQWMTLDSRTSALQNDTPRPPVKLLIGPPVIVRPVLIRELSDETPGPGNPGQKPVVEVFGATLDRLAPHPPNSGGPVAESSRRIDGSGAGIAVNGEALGAGIAVNGEAPEAPRPASQLRVPSAASPPAPQENPGAAGFETFSVPRPQGSIPRSMAPRPRSDANPGSVAIPLGAPPPGVGNGVTLTSTISLTPWDRTLFFGLNGQLGGRELNSFLEVDPRTGIPIINAGYVSLQQQDAAIRVGQGSNDLFGASTGLGYNVQRKHGLSYGAGIYSLTSGLDSRLAPALNAQLALGSAGSLGALGAADGSWRVSAREQRSRISIYSSLGSLSRTGGVDYGAGFNFRLLHGVSLAEQVTGRGGRNAFSGNETSLEMRQGPALVSLSLWNSHDISSRAAQQSLTALIPHGGNLLILRYQAIDSAAPGQLDQRETDLSAGIWRTYRSGFATWAQVDRFGGGALGWQGGVSAPVLGRGQIDLQVGDRPDQGFTLQRGRIGFRLRTNDLIGLSYGPGISRRSDGRTGWGVDFTREFHFEPASKGSLAGRVDSIGGPLPSGVAVLIDGRQRIKVGPDGRFTVSRISAGPHRVALDLTHAPAAWGAAASEQEVIVRSRRKSEVSLVAQLLAGIRGSVRCLAPLPAATGAGHPFGDIVITLSNGHSTVTDEDGGYRFENLPPGDYQVTLAAAAIPNGYSPLGPTKWTLHVDPGDHLTHADFTLEPNQKPVIFADLGG